MSGEISLDDDEAPPAHERTPHDPAVAWQETYHETTPAGIGGRKGMIDRAAVLHDLYGEHPAECTSRAAFLRWAGMFQLSQAELEQAACAWERSFYQLDRVRAL